MSVLSHQASNSSQSDVILCTSRQYCVSLSVCCRGMFFMVSGQSVLMTTAQFNSDVMWTPRGQADNQCRREWVLRQHAMRISMAMPMRGPM